MHAKWNWSRIIETEMHGEIHAKWHDEIQAKIHSKVRAKLPVGMQAGIHAEIYANLPAQMKAEMYATMHAKMYGGVLRRSKTTTLWVRPALKRFSHTVCTAGAHQRHIKHFRCGLRVNIHAVLKRLL